MASQALEGVLPLWSALADDVDARPFDRPEWALAWTRAFGRGRLEPATLMRDGRLVAVLPLLRTPGRARSVTNWQVPELPLVALDAEAREDLLVDVFARRTAFIEVDFLSADAVRDPVGVVAARGAWRRPVVRSVGRAPYVDLGGGTFDQYERGLSRNRRRSLRSGWRRIRECGRVSVDVSTGGDDLGDRLGEFMAVEAAGWKGSRKTAVASSAATRTFYADVAAWAASRGWLRLSSLRLDGRAIAVDLALVHRGTWFSLKAGYDERFREFGPGALLVHALLERAHDEGLRRFDLLANADPFKDAWATGARPLVRVQAFRPTPSGALSLAETAARARLWPLAAELRAAVAAGPVAAGAQQAFLSPGACSPGTTPSGTRTP